jgi:hypothetical protein
LQWEEENKAKKMIDNKGICKLGEHAENVVENKAQVSKGIQEHRPPWGPSSTCLGNILY